jgi:hypothetical protein
MNMLSVVAPLAVAGALALAGCDPCAGTANCTTAPQVTLTGNIVDHATGAGVAGAKIDAQLGGGNGFSATASATTDANGVWQLRADTPGQDQLQAQVTVTSPNRPAYTVPAFTVKSSTNRGDAVVVGQWSDVPYMDYQATLTHGALPLIDAAVHFVPTSGPPLTSSQSDASTNGAGIFELDFSGTTVGTITGTLTVTGGGLPHGETLQGFQIPLDYHYGVPASRGDVPVGAQLAYGGQAIFRGTNAATAGVGVEFVRTGGIDVTPTDFTTTSGASGFFRIDLAPATDGTVTGTLTLRPPNGPPTSYPNVQLATFDSTSIRSLGLWAYGERWLWTVELWRNDSLEAAPGVGVTFQQTGGIAISPDTIGGLVTGPDGRIQLTASTQDTGYVDGNLIVQPASGPPRTITGLHLRTNADDQLHFGGVFSFGPALRYVGEVKLADGTPVVGAQCTWTQTSGIAATPTTLVDTTDVNGRFSLLFYPSQDGFIVGTVTVVPPPPWAAGTVFTFTNLQLNSFDSPDLVLAVTYRIPPP